MRRYITIIAFLLFCVVGFAQTKGSIVGKVTDKEANNASLPFASVFIKGTSIGTTSDIDGIFEIANVDPGTYIVVFSFVGYETVEIPNVIVEADKETTVDAILGASTANLDEVIITTTTKRESETKLLLEQKKATEIKQIIGSEELSRKGVSDAAGAVAKISGISKQEGSSNVYVRGLGDRYQTTTMNGLSLPSNDVNKKNIDLNLFPSEIIENVSISKAYTPSFYGDFAAGNVNIDSKEYSGKGYIAVSTGSGVNSNAAGQNFVRSEGPSYFGFYNRYEHNPFAVILSHPVDPQSAAAPIDFNGAIEGGYSFKFGDESRLSFFGTASFSNGYEFLEGPALDFTNDIKVRFNNVEEYAYSTNTTALGNITYKIDTNHKLKFTSLFINSSKDAVGYYGTKGLGFNRDGFSSNGDGGFYQMNVQFNQDKIFVNQLNGTHKFGNEDKWKLDWGIGSNKVLSDEPDRKRFSLEDYQFALDNDPDTNPIFYDNIAFDNQRFFQSIEDEELNSYVKLENKVAENVKLVFGYNGRTKERRFKNWRYGYEILDKNANPVTNVNNLSTFFDFSNINAPDGEGLWNLNIARNPNGLDTTLGLTNVPQLYENKYTGNLDIHAGFALAELTFGEKWLVVPGIRLEAYEQSIVYDVINPVPTDTGRRSVKDNFILPSLNIKYGLNENTNLRFSFSKTVSIPEFKEVANFVYESVTQRVGGNPDLLGKPDGSGVAFSDIYNYDLKYEWFPSRGEIIAIAAFAKTIHDPVNRVVAADATGNQRYFRTGNKAEVFGIELEARKTLLQNEDEETLLSAGANFAYTHTKQDLQDISTADGFTFGTSFNKSSEEIQGASPFIANADISFSPKFKNYEPKATAIFSYFSDRIQAIGSGDLGNIVEKGVPTLDFILQNKIGKNFEVNFSVKNILNPNISLVRDDAEGLESSTLLQGFVSNNEVTLREYKRGVNFGLSLKYKF